MKGTANGTFQKMYHRGGRFLRTLILGAMPVLVSLLLLVTGCETRDEGRGPLATHRHGAEPENAPQDGHNHCKNLNLSQLRSTHHLDYVDVEAVHEGAERKKIQKTCRHCGGEKIPPHGPPVCSRCLSQQRLERGNTGTSCTRCGRVSHELTHGQSTCNFCRTNLDRKMGTYLMNPFP